MQAVVDAFNRSQDRIEVEYLAMSAYVDRKTLLATAKNMSPKEYRKHWNGNSEEERRENSRNKAPGQFMYAMSEAEVMELQLETLRTGTIGRSAGGTIHAFKTFGRQIGWANGEKAYEMRAEMTGPKANKSIHSHPR